MMIICIGFSWLVFGSLVNNINNPRHVKLTCSEHTAGPSYKVKLNRVSSSPNAHEALQDWELNFMNTLTN